MLRLSKNFAIGILGKENFGTLIGKALIIELSFFMIMEIRLGGFSARGGRTLGGGKILMVGVGEIKVVATTSDEVPAWYRVGWGGGGE